VNTRRGWPAAGALGLTLLVIGGIATRGTLPAVAAPTAGARHTIVLRVASISMEPTLRPGQMITVDLRAYRTRRPSIGDIVVYHPPHGADSLSPRCGAAREGAGWPRDRISIRNGHVIRNGVRERDRYIAGCGGDSDCNFRAPVVIPTGDYFMMGDNRGLSDDSRFWGPVRRSWILGTVVNAR
jgi:signal peptidase I